MQVMYRFEMPDGITIHFSEEATRNLQRELQQAISRSHAYGSLEARVSMPGGKIHLPIETAQKLLADTTKVVSSFTETESLPDHSADEAFEVDVNVVSE